MSQINLISVDLETPGKNTWKDDILNLNFATENSHFVQLVSFMKLLLLNIFVKYIFLSLQALGFSNLEAPGFWSFYVLFHSN